MSNFKTISLKQLKKVKSIDVVVFESLEQALYRMEVQFDGDTYLVMNGEQSLTARNLLELQKHLIRTKVGKAYLKHCSPYDEMIGVDTQSGNNTLLVPIRIPNELIN